MVEEEGGTNVQQKRTWAAPELCFDGLLRDLVQSGAKSVSAPTGDGPDPFKPKGL